MAATGYTPIQLYYSTTALAVPSSGNLLSGELALNIIDEKLYFKNSSGTIKLLASTASAAATVSSVSQTFTGGIITASGSPITTSGTLALTIAGTSGGIPYFSGSTTWATSAALTANAIVLGGGAGLPPATLASTGTTTTVLHGNASGAPTFGAVSLTADVSGTLPIANGGTNLTTYTTGDILYASATNVLSKLAVGTNGQVLTLASGIPSWATASGGVTTISFGSIGLTPSTATSGAVSVAGTLVAANGGTGQSSYAVGDLLYASTTTALSKLADVATGNALISGGVGVAPSYGKIGLTTHVSGTLAVGNGGTGATTFTTNSVVLGNGTSSLSANMIAPSTAGNVLTSNGTTWVSQAPSGGGVQSAYGYVANCYAFGNCGNCPSAVAISQGINTALSGTALYAQSGTQNCNNCNCNC
jgi:hypothetical protein